VLGEITPPLATPPPNGTYYDLDVAHRFGRACNSEDGRNENEKTTPSARDCGAHKFGTDLDFFGRV